MIPAYWQARGVLLPLAVDASICRTTITISTAVQYRFVILTVAPVPISLNPQLVQPLGLTTIPSDVGGSTSGKFLIGGALFER